MQVVGREMLVEVGLVGLGMHLHVLMGGNTRGGIRHAGEGVIVVVHVRHGGRKHKMRETAGARGRGLQVRGIV